MASSAWEKRNTAARAKGYRNYYDYRVHRYGTRPPSEAPASGEEAAQLRGHRGRKSLAAVLRNPERVALIVEVPHTTRGGQWTQMRFVTTFTDADIREYTVDIDSQADLDYWHGEIYDAGIDLVEYASKAGGAAAAAA